MLNAFWLIYFIPNLRIINRWLKTLNLILPLFSSILLFAILFELDLEVQFMQIIRISYYILLSVYLTGTADLDQLKYFAKKVKKLAVLYSIIYFFLITFEISKRLADRFKKCRNEQDKIGKCIQKAISSVFSDLDLLSEEVNIMITEAPDRRKLIGWSDLMFIPLLFAEVILIVSVI
jgi:hypothetical protein